MKRDICYGTDFEERVASFLESNGHKVYRSVYAQLGRRKCQIDLVVFDGVLPIVIECKGWDAKKIIYKRSANFWNYVDVAGKVRQVPNPLRQAKNHIEILTANIRNDIEGTLESGRTIGGYEYRLFLKGDIPDYKSERLFTERSYDEFLESVTYSDEDTNLFPEDYKKAVSAWLEEHSDVSEKRLKEHKEYLKECKANRTGVFDENEYRSPLCSSWEHDSWG